MTRSSVHEAAFFGKVSPGGRASCLTPVVEAATASGAHLPMAGISEGRPAAEAFSHVQDRASWRCGFAVVGEVR